MKIRAHLTVENGAHAALKWRKLVFQLTDAKTAKDVDAKTTSDGDLTWESDDFLENGFDSFTFFLEFYGRDGGKAILSVTQSVYLKKDGSFACDPLTTWPRPYGGLGQPLLDIEAKVASGVAQVHATVHTSMVDLTDHWIDLERALPANWMGADASPANWTLRFLRGSADDDGGCDIRMLGALGGKSAVTPLAVAIPPAAQSGVANLGAFVFYGPKRPFPDITIPPDKPPPKDGAAPPLVNEMFGFMDGVRRYLKAPGFSTGKVFDGDVEAGQRRPYFGPTVDEDGGIDPNCQMAAQVARVNKPVILILGWGSSGWPKVTRTMAGAAIRLLWGQNMVAKDQDKGVKVARFGIGGFSLGGASAMMNIDDEDDEVWLFDPNTATDNASGWFRKDPDKRRLRCISGVMFSQILSTVKARVQDKVKSVGATSSGQDKKNFSWFPSGMLEDEPGKQGKPYWLDYYSPKPDVCHPQWRAAFDYFVKINQTSLAEWRAHQWTVYGGEVGASPIAPDFRTFFGQCLEQSDY